MNCAKRTFHVWFHCQHYTFVGFHNIKGMNVGTDVIYCYCSETLAVYLLWGQNLTVGKSLT